MDVISSQNILTAAEVDQILVQATGDKNAKLLDIEVCRASDGIIGFLGDHKRMTIHAEVKNERKKIHLFIKLTPPEEEALSDFINEYQFFTREALILKLFEEISRPDPNPWCVTAYLKNEKMVVMPDLAIEGYKVRPSHKPDDIPHVMLAGTALARFHAAFANYETKMIQKFGKDSFSKKYGDQLQEKVFLDNLWLRSGMLTHVNVLKALSSKYNDLGDIDLVPLYLKASQTVHPYSDTLNTLIHRDLWANNIMFKYEDGVPTNALLIDFQLARFAPPAFDTMIFLYMYTTKSFRDQHEEAFLKHYYSTFMQHVDEDTKKRLDELKYDWSAFRGWCEKARMFGNLVAILISPYGLMDSNHSRDMVDGDNDNDKMWQVDRSKLIIDYANKNETYKKRILEFFEEFIYRFVRNE